MWLQGLQLLYYTFFVVFSRFQASGMSKSLTLAVADKLASSAIQTALSRKFAPITVVVLDAAGHTVVSKRMDGCSPVGYTQFAHAKANTALITKGISIISKQLLCSLPPILRMSMTFSLGPFLHLQERRGD